MFNKKENALVQMADANQAQLGIKIINNNDKLIYKFSCKLNKLIASTNVILLESAFIIIWTPLYFEIKKILTILWSLKLIYLLEHIGDV